MLPVLLPETSKSNAQSFVHPHTFIVKLWEDDSLNQWLVDYHSHDSQRHGKWKDYWININTMAYSLIVISNDANYLKDVYSATNRYVWSI